MSRFPILFAVGATALLAGCASTYDLTLMPRSSGKTYTGEAVETSVGSEARVTIDIEGRQYTGTWVATAPARTSSYVTGGVGFGFGRWGSRSGIGLGTVVGDNPYGGEAKALLRAADGAGLRCDFQGMGPGRTGGGTCMDDKGMLYDVQIRLKGNQ